MLKSYAYDAVDENFVGLFPYQPINTDLFTLLMTTGKIAKYFSGTFKHFLLDIIIVI